MKSKSRSGSKSKITIGPVLIVIVAGIIGFWYLKKHTNIFGGASLTEATSIAAQEKKKLEQNKIASVGGGSRKQDYLKVKFY